MNQLGKKTDFTSTYNPTLLFPIARQEQRSKIGIDSAKLPFYGFDCWNHYEVSWLNPNGKPHVALAEIIYGCDSPFIIESKSLKLYFNSLNNTVFENIETLEHTIKNDLEKNVEKAVFVKIIPLNKIKTENHFQTFSGENIDHLDVPCDVYTVDPSFLITEEITTQEILCSDLLKSNCLITHQPDWASIQIAYEGNKISREGLLKYLVSFRNHNEFHEQCIERIFMDIMQKCRPTQLTVYGRYTRRGGLDINPYRSTEELNHSLGENIRLGRQ